MPKLLQIDSCLGILSTGRISEGIAKVAMSQGWDCYIAHGARFVGKTIQHSYQIETKYGEYIHYVKSLLLDKHGLGSTSSTKRLIKKIKEIKPDVIQLHCIHGYYLNYKVLFEYLSDANIPVVWTQHDCWAFTGHCAYFGFSDCEKWKNECFRCPLSHSYPKAFIDRSRSNYRLKKKLFTSVKNMTVVSVSKWLDSIVKESFLSIYPHRAIYNGIDTESFRPYDEIIREKYGIKTPHFLLAVASAWSDKKGLIDYIELSELLPDDYSIVLVGIDEEYREKLPAKITTIPRTDSKQELAMLYSNADFVTSLSYCETMGLTIVEGLACGTPTIVYDNTAQPEIASGGVGYVIPTGDYKQIPGILSKDRDIPLKEKDLRRQTCIKRAKQAFDDAKQYEQYVGLYSDLINRSKPDGGGVIIALASTWSERKGLKDYIKLSSLLPEECRIILIGLTTEQIKLVSERPNIIGISRTSNLDELLFYYSIANAVLNLSYEETFGLTTVEGMACGTPSVLYNITASPELIDETAGIVVEPGDVEGVMRAVDVVLKNGKSFYHEACRTRAESMFSAKDRYHDYMELYSKLIKK